MITFEDSDLCSRTNARLIRTIDLERELRASELVRFVEFDLKNVKSMSHSFADELFAVLVEQHGIEWFKTHIKLSNMNDNVKKSIANAIRYRIAIDYKITNQLT